MFSVLLCHTCCRNYLRTYSQISNQVKPIYAPIFWLPCPGGFQFCIISTLPSFFTDYKIPSLANTHTLIHTLTHLWSCSLYDSDTSSLTHFELKTCSNVLDMNNCVGNLLLLSFCCFFWINYAVVLEQGTPPTRGLAVFPAPDIKKENHDCGRPTL